LYELAQEFSRFYERDQVVGGENAALRKKLVQAYVGVMEAGLKILGVPSVERV
jgi:arginyl-tRNA synthetase